MRQCFYPRALALLQSMYSCCMRSRKKKAIPEAQANQTIFRHTCAITVRPPAWLSSDMQVLFSRALRLQALIYPLASAELLPNNTTLSSRRCVKLLDVPQQVPSRSLAWPYSNLVGSDFTAVSFCPTFDYCGEVASYGIRTFDHSSFYQLFSKSQAL